MVIAASPQPAARVARGGHVLLHTVTAWNTTAAAKHVSRDRLRRSPTVACLYVPEACERARLGDALPVDADAALDDQLLALAPRAQAGPGEDLLDALAARVRREAPRRPLDRLGDLLQMQGFPTGRVRLGGLRNRRVSEFFVIRGMGIAAVRAPAR